MQQGNSKEESSKVKVESFLDFWKDLKFFLFFHNKHHLVEYLSEKESDELTEAEKVLLEQIILSAVDDKLEMKLRLDRRLQRDKKEDDYATKLFRIVRGKAFGEEDFWEGSLSDYVSTIVPTYGEDGLNTYRCRIKEIKQLQKWYKLENSESSGARILYRKLPPVFKYSFENVWKISNHVKDFRTQEELEDVIKEDLNL